MDHARRILCPFSRWKTAGAQHAYNELNENGKLIAYAVAGHHAGLPDGKTNETTCLVRRLRKDIPDYSAAPHHILKQTLPLHVPITVDKKRACFQFSFFTRILFSSLVDADFLDTEHFMQADKSVWRKGYPGLPILEKTLIQHLEDLLARAPSSNPNN